MNIPFKLFSLIFCLLVFVISCERIATSDYSAPIETDVREYPEEKATQYSEDSIRLTAEIVGIKDGDTVEALYNDELQMTVRLAHIDAPEKRNSQPFGKASKNALSELCFGQNVTLVSKGEGERDRYGRLIAVIINEDKVNCNRAMVRLGYAWHFTRFSDNLIYADLEDEARISKVGLWQDDLPIAPWEWRKR